MLAARSVPAVSGLARVLLEVEGIGGQVTMLS
jgi:hypothetical protein